MKRISLATVGILFCAISMAKPAEGLRGGLARIDITPGKPVMMFGYASRTNLSTGVHDPLSARAMAIEQDGKRLVLMSVELCGFYNGTAEPFRESILKKSGLGPAE